MPSLFLSPPFYQSTLPLRLRVVAGRFDFVWHLSDHESEDAHNAHVVVDRARVPRLPPWRCKLPPAALASAAARRGIPPAPQPARPPGRRPHLYGCGGRAAAAAAACADTYAPAHPGSIRALLYVRAARRLHAPASCRVCRTYRMRREACPPAASGVPCDRGTAGSRNGRAGKGGLTLASVG